MSYLATDPAAFSALIKAELARVPDTDSWAHLAARLRAPEGQHRRRRLPVVFGIAAAVVFLAAGAAVASETNLVDQFHRFTKSHQQPAYPTTEWMIWAMATAKSVSLGQAQSNGQFPLLTSSTGAPTSVDQLILPCSNCSLAYRLIYPVGEGVTATVYETLAPLPGPGKSTAIPAKDPSLVETRNVAGNTVLVYYTARDHTRIPAVFWTTSKRTQVGILFGTPTTAQEAFAFAASFH
jgi:hypothetical protein